MIEELKTEYRNVLRAIDTLKTKSLSIKEYEDACAHFVVYDDTDLCPIVNSYEKLTASDIKQIEEAERHIVRIPHMYKGKIVWQ